MSPTPARAEVQAVLATLSDSLRSRDAQAVARLFYPDAKIYDLAPPLARGVSVDGLAEWLAGWDGPVEQDMSGLDVRIDGDLAVGFGLVRVETTRGGEALGWWMRATCVLARSEQGWRIIHEHTSVPFHMDGSYRAAIDLTP